MLRRSVHPFEKTPKLPFYQPTMRRRIKKGSSRGRTLCLAVLLLSLVLLLVLWNKHADGNGLRGSILKKQREERWTTEDVEQWNQQLETWHVDEILEWAHDKFATEIIQMTSFGPSGLVLLHKWHTLGLLSDIPVITVDTLHLFDETYTLIQQIQDEYNVEMHLNVYRPKDVDSRTEFDEIYGASLWKTNGDKYDYLTKVEPTLRALDEFQPAVWITGRRRSQGGERVNLPIVEWDENSNNQRLKLNPLARWTYQDIWDYIHEHNLTYNPLHDKGYKSIGDTMTTVAVAPEAPERSGRFVGLEGKTECGMHAHLIKVQQMKEKALSEGNTWVMPTVPCDHCLEVNTDNFDQLILHQNATKYTLLEFYSPLCGACQEFGPKLRHVANVLWEQSDIRVARFDLTENAIPDSATEAGFQIEATPTLLLVEHYPSFAVTKYSGPHDTAQTILNWLQQEGILNSRQ